MVSKLIKHEWIALLRKLIPIWAVVIGVGIITRLVFLTSNDSVASEILCGSAVILCVLANLVSLVLTAVLLITRFYKNMFTKEGYLTLTLPATPTQHLIAKGLTAFCVILCSVLACAISATCAVFGDFGVELLRAADYLYRTAVGLFGADVPIMTFEVVVLLLLSGITEIFFFYMIMSLGQLAKKNRIAASVGIYFIFYFAFQFLSTIFSILTSTVFALIDIADWVETLKVSAPSLIHGALLLFIVVNCVLTVVYFLVSRMVIAKKLNLE